MTPRRALRIVLVSASVGLIIGIPFGGDDLVSTEVWLAASAVTAVIATMADLLVAARLEHATISPAWASAAEGPPAQGPLEVRHLRALVMSAGTSPKVYSRRLRPHLIHLARHFLTLRHGLDLERDAPRVAELLDDLYWLINPTVNDRAPGPDELERFLDIVVDDHPRSMSSHSAGATNP